MKNYVKSEYFSLTTHLEYVEESTEVLASRIILENKGLSLIDAVRIGLELVEGLEGSLNWGRIRQAIALGTSSLIQQESSASFEHVLSCVLESKRGRSPRTIEDIRQTMRRLMQDHKGLAERPVSTLSTKECADMLHHSYGHSASRFIKARANLSGLFSLALRRGWCEENPVLKIEKPLITEKVITPLTLGELRRLFHVAQCPDHIDCLPALALMTFAGIRPDELQRLTWEDIDWDEKEILLAPRHSKTGGGRHVPLVAPLMNILREHRASGSICPSNWLYRWRLLRQIAGFSAWVPDVLRHSYASYHAKHFHNLPQLQLAMGHRDCQLLLTRYVNLRGLDKHAAELFWQGEFLQTKRAKS